MDNIQIGRLIYEKRKELGLTQQELADRLQITNKAVSKWENGDGMPDVNLLAPLAKELGLTVDELLNGEEKILDSASEYNTDETEIYKKPLTGTSPVVEIKDAVIGMIMYSMVIYRVLGELSQIYMYFMMYSDNLPSFLAYFAISAYNIVFWTLISAVIICKALRIYDIEIERTKSITIAAFVLGLPMLVVQSFDGASINYGCFFFIFALLLSECHGYRTPHKIFYGLAILATAVYGTGMIFGEVNLSNLSDKVEMTQFLGFIMRLVRALIFYIMYGVFEKSCDGYER